MVRQAEDYKSYSMFQSTNKKSLTTVKPLIRDYLDLTFCHLQELGPYWVTFLPQLLGQILPHVKSTFPLKN